MMLYKYGAMSWVWRGLIAFGLILASGFLITGLASWSFWLFVGGLAMIAPSLFFGTVLVVQAEKTADETLEIRTLLFFRRRIELVRLGAPVVRRKYHDAVLDFDAPRAWVPVKGSLPLYFDLLGQIPDRQAFMKTVGLTSATLRAAE